MKSDEWKEGVHLVTEGPLSGLWRVCYRFNGEPQGAKLFGGAYPSREAADRVYRSNR